MRWMSRVCEVTARQVFVSMSHDYYGLVRAFNRVALDGRSGRLIKKRYYSLQDTGSAHY